MKRLSSTLINQADQITIGWAVDGEGRRTYFDLQAQAKSGSSLSNQISALASNRSSFTGFMLEGAAVVFQGSLRVSEKGQDQIASLLDFV